MTSSKTSLVLCVSIYYVSHLVLFYKRSVSITAPEVLSVLSVVSSVPPVVPSVVSSDFNCVNFTVSFLCRRCTKLHQLVHLFKLPTSNQVYISVQTSSGRRFTTLCCWRKNSHTFFAHRKLTVIRPLQPRQTTTMVNPLHNGLKSY